MMQLREETSKSEVTAEQSLAPRTQAMGLGKGLLEAAHVVVAKCKSKSQIQVR